MPPQPVARLIILHGYGDHAGRYTHFMQWMADHQISTYALDFRGHGRSAGKWCHVNRWNDCLDDLQSMLAVPQLNQHPLFILGHSHGGLIAAIAAIQGLLNHCKGIILSAPYLQLQLPIPRSKRLLAAIAAHVYPSLKMPSGLLPELLTSDPVMQAETANDPLCRGIATPGWFYQTLKVQQQAMQQARLFKLPLYMLIPGDDVVASPQANQTFFDQTSSIDKTVKHYPTHRHELLRDLDREMIFQDIQNWIAARQ